MVILWSQQEEENISFATSTPNRALITTGSSTHASPDSGTSSVNFSDGSNSKYKGKKYPDTPSGWRNSYGDPEICSPSSSRFMVAMKDTKTPRKVNLFRSSSVHQTKSSSILPNAAKLSTKCQNGDSLLSAKSYEPVDVTRSPAVSPKFAHQLCSTDSEHSKAKKVKERFYSLPRNWRGKNTDFIWKRANKKSKESKNDGCFKRKRSLTPAYGPTNDITYHPAPLPSTSEATETTSDPITTLPNTSENKGINYVPAVASISQSVEAKVAATTLSVNCAQVPAAVRVTSSDAPATQSVYNPFHDEDEYVEQPAAVPLANPKYIWAGSPGPGPYGDYKPVSVLDNRTQSRSTGNLLDYDARRSAYYFERGGSRSRPVTPSSGTYERSYATARRSTPPIGYRVGSPTAGAYQVTLRGQESGGRKVAGGSEVERPLHSAQSYSTPSGRSSLSKTLCEYCKKKCSGEVLRVQEKYYHVSCFACKGCKKSLAQGGFFTRDSFHYCPDCYQSQFGQKCATCGLFVEGEVVSALGNTYHQKCFTCARCRQPFPSGERVTYTGKECLCQRCFQIPVMNSQSPVPSPSQPGPKCAGCSDELMEGQALIALDRQWHIWCFKCAACNTLLHGEYMGKDGEPYCEKDYQAQFGVKCAYCDRFISGKVLQAGDNHHFHPTCARCTKCGDPFGDGEEMYLQGTAIWHPRCGPGPTESGTVINGHSPSGVEEQITSNGHHLTSNGVHSDPQKSPQEKDADGISSTASETQLWTSRTPSLNGSLRSASNIGTNSLNRKYSGPYRTCSPGLILREYHKSSRNSPVDISRIYTYSYLAAEPAQGYLKKPIDPYDRPPKSPHFHRPPEGERPVRTPLGKIPVKTGMRVLVNQIKSETPRPKSPKMNNEEPISLAHYPGGQKPKASQPSRIEREDFPAPPYPYTDPERRRRWSGSSKGVSIDESAEELLEMREEEEDIVPVDPKLKREEEELEKVGNGIGKVFLHQVREREKIRAWKANHLDPRNASRTPSATREPVNRLRFDSSYNASPSRVADGSRWTDDEFDGGHPSQRSSGRSSATLPSYSATYRSPPKHRHNFKYSTLPNFTRSRPMETDYSHQNGDTNSLGGMGDKTHSTDFSSARSDVSAGSLTEADRNALAGNGPDICPSATYSSGLRGYSSTSSRYSPHLRRSLPNMLHPSHPPHPNHISNHPPKIYPAHLLFTTNYRLPSDVDRCHLERHLSDQDFEIIFRMSRVDFYRMPPWQRNDIKRRLQLF